mmetsp:Transcript_78013/g.210995  ORF Transcript_78013/g.210995 Transcript_78013/m.210995 type:complete len:294 (-) Transcript_78013:42-923(-)
MVAAVVSEGRMSRRLLSVCLVAGALQFTRWPCCFVPSPPSSPAPLALGCGCGSTAAAQRQHGGRRGGVRGRRPGALGLRQPTTPRGRPSLVARHADPDEAIILSTVRNHPDDPRRIDRLLAALPQPNLDAVRAVTGDWRVEWDSSLLARSKAKRLLNSICPELPRGLVEVHSTYNRLYDNTYQWVVGFMVPGTERVDAAVVLSGPYKQGQGKSGGFDLELTDVRAVTADSNADESKALLFSIGLGSFLNSRQIGNDGPIHVDLRYVGQDTSVQVDEGGNILVLTRSKIPYILD